ncbi:M48 family metallopeptidase [bacterium]|nr:M48 family metallopeptidase [bacterium]MBU1995478.1 M48 family metallopeptidase [bacterium]
MNEIIFKNLKIEHICKSNLKNSYISVLPHAKIILKTPRVSQDFITNLLIEKEEWIRKQLLKTQQNPPKRINFEDEVLLFGEIYSIDVDEAEDLRLFIDKLRVDSHQNILKCYDNFYKHYANKYLTPRIAYFAQVMRLDYKEIKFKKMRSRWGSCSSNKTITLNTELIKIKKELIDYVIVHELAHLVYMNHSKKFHDLVQNYLPSSKFLRYELKSTHIV